jgi:hypothetical protein
MRRSACLFWLLAAATLAPATAQPARQAVAEAECEPKRQSCVAECRAQYFTIDPKRTGCAANCAAVAARCTREQSGR